jgi:hypothetical protein
LGVLKEAPFHLRLMRLPVTSTASDATTWTTMLETVPIVKRKDEQAHSAYRTKYVILAIYDAMQQAIETGTAYPLRPHTARYRRK